MSKPGSTSEQYGHEPDRTSVWGTVWTIIGLSVLIALTLIVVYWFLGEVRAHRPPPPVYARPQPEVQQPSLALQDWTQPVASLEEMRQHEHARLFEYEWIDRDAGRVQIPIGRAMELLAARGQPTTASAPATAPASSAANTSNPSGDAP